MGGAMNIRVRRSAMVRPSEPTPQRRLWNSNLDLVVVQQHTPSVYFYRRARILNNFFDVAVLETALARVLVQFYPVAGRLVRDEDRRIEIDCNAEGVLFVAAEADGTVDDFGDFAPTPEMKRLIPSVEYTDDVSSFPLLMLQVTYFQCGGVALGVGMQHHVADGYTGINFINSWANLARGLPPTIRPFIDHTLLCACDPPTPSFPHVEYHPPPAMSTGVISPSPTSNKATATVVRMFELTRTRIDELRARVPPGSPKFSSFALIAGHVWRCACLARGLPADQLTKLYIAVDGRQRLKPPLPDGYIGNVIFTATPIAAAGEVVAGLPVAAAKVQGTLARMDDEYMKSVLDYLQVQPDLTALAKGPHTFRCPNLGLTSWVRLPIHDADFGWGRPAFMGPGGIAYEGLAYVLPTSTGDGSQSMAISLQAEHMDEFGKLIYQI